MTTAFDTCLPIVCDVPSALNKIPFSKDELNNKTDTHILVYLPETINGLTLTLNTLVDRSNLFYPQDWYRQEEFANAPAEPKWYLVRKDIKVRSVPSPLCAPALAYAFTFVSWWTDYQEALWADSYVWCSDWDSRGDRIYVGGYSRGYKTGFQIHRHLKITEDWGVAI